MSFTLRIPLKEGIGGERRHKDRVKTGLVVTLLITLLCGGFAHPLKIRAGFYAREGPQFFLVSRCLSLGSTTLVSRHFKAEGRASGPTLLLYLLLAQT
jgi:hypothetical protein